MEVRRLTEVAAATAIAAGLLAASEDAWAQARICEYAVADWVADLEAIGAALRDGDEREAQVQVDLVDKDLECLSEPVPVQPLLRYTQYRVLLALGDLDTDEALRWARAGEAVMPGGAWPAWVDADHPARSLIEREGPANVVTVPGKYPAHPKKGGVFVNGAFATEATGPSYTPIFVQAFDEGGATLAGFWNDGPHLRAPWLTESPRMAEVDPPRWWAPSDLVVDDGPIALAAPPPPPAPVEASPAAPATSAVDCPSEPVTVATIGALSTAATEAFATMDRARFAEIEGALPNAIGCLSEVMTAEGSAVVHRLHAYRSFVAGEDAGALRSFQVALGLDPGHVLPESVAPAGGPLHTLYERSRQSPPVATVPFGTPPGMTAYVDGAARTRRPISAPAFVQLVTPEGVYWSAYLTPEDPLPDWLPSAEEALLATVGEAVIDDFVALRAAQAARQPRVDAARAALLSDAERAFTATATAARVGDDAGRAALERYVATYDGAVVVVDGESEDVVVPQVAAARAWLRIYGEEGVETKVAAHAVEVEAARKDTREVASGEWKHTEELIAQADYGGQEAVTAFIDRYDDATVSVGDAAERVFVPEVDVAQDWSAIYGLASQTLPDTSDSLKVVLGITEQRAALDRELMRRISDETAALLSGATREWRAAMAVAETDIAAARPHVAAFAMRYRGATVVIEEERILVDVPEVRLADAWLAEHPEPIATDVELRAWPPVRRNVAIAAGGLAVAGGGLWIASKVFHDASLATAADLDEPFSKAESQAVGANTTAALSIATFAATAGLGIVVIAW